MLTNEFGEKWSKRLKYDFFKTQMALMSNRLKLPFFMHYGLAIIMFWLNMSIFFVTNPLTPQTFNDIFQLPLLPGLSQRISVPLEIFKVLMIVMDLNLIVLYAIHFKSNFMNKSLTKALNFLIFVSIAAIVPTSHLTMTSLKSINIDTQITTILINVSLAILFVISKTIVGAFTYFKVRPFRKKSIFWSLDNKKEFYCFVVNFLRVLVIMFDGKTVSFTIISFVIEIFVRQSFSQCFTKEAKTIQSFLSNLTLSVHLALLAKDFTTSPDFATEIMVFFLLATLITGALSCYSLIREQRYFPLCNSSIWQFYDFYFHFLEKKIKGNNQSNMSIKKDSDSEKILSIHSLNCHEKSCKIKSAKFSEETYCEDLENLISEAIASKSNQSVINELVNELWKFETGNKYKFRMEGKNITILSEFIIYCVLNISRLNEKSDSVDQQNVKALKNIFYDKFQNCLEFFSLFYEEIAKTQPKIDTILSVGNQIKKKAEDLKSLYSELLKHSVINFKTAQAYVEFQNYFLKESNSNDESIDRLKKILQSSEADHIEEIYLPTLTSYADSGLIENMNTECLSFFRLTRFEMKSKIIGSLLYPEVNSIEQIKQRLKKKKKEKMCTFFKHRNEIVYGSISIKQKYFENKKFDVITIEKNSHSDYKNVILVNKSTLKIEGLEKEETYIRPNINFSSHLTFKWRYIYQTHLQSKINQLAQQKIVKVRIEELENSLFIMNLEESLHEDCHVVNIKVIKDIERKRNRVSTSMINKTPASAQKSNKFYFCYDLKKSKTELHLYGYNSENYTYASSLKKNCSFKKFDKEMSNMLVANTLLNENRYTKGIKTYRLWEQDLYNIDLEDKEKYVEQFADKISNSTDKAKGEKSETDLYLITSIFSVLVILVGMSLGYNTVANSLHYDLVGYFSDGLKIQQLRLQMNRITSITRDIEYNVYERYPFLNWKNDLLASYSSIKQLRYQSLLFESEQVVVKYRNINYSGTLNEILDVMMSHVYEMTLNPPTLQEINFFHECYIADINLRIVAGKDKLSNKISNAAQDFGHFQTIILIVGITCIFAFYLLLGLLIVVLNNSAKKKLENLMMMSDTEARTNQIMAEKLKYAVDMTKKNFDFDLKTVIGPVEKHKQRRKSKQVIISIQKKLMILLALIVSFVVHFIVFYMFINEISTVLSTVGKYQKQGESFLQIYSGLTELSNQISHFNKYDTERIINLKRKLVLINRERLSFEFDADTKDFINSVFYENACNTQYKDFIFEGELTECENSIPDYIVNSPFQIGVIPFLTDSTFYIIDDSTQMYGYSGLFSSPFIKVFSVLAEKIRNCGLNFIEQSFKQLYFFNLVYSIMSLMYTLITLRVIYVLKGMNKEISQLLKFLSYNGDSHKKTKGQDKQNEGDMKEEFSNSTTSQKNENSLNASDERS